MSLHEAARPDVPLRELVDGRICPPDQVIEWDTPALTAEEVALVNHTHGLIGNFIAGPDEINVAIGMRTLGQLEAFDEATHAVIDSEQPNIGYESFVGAVIEKSVELREGLSVTVSNLRYAGKQDEIVPEIVKQYSAEFAYPDGTVEDLSLLGLLRAAHTQAIRQGVSHHLRTELEIDLDQLLARKFLKGESPTVTLETQDGGDGVEGKLEGIHRDFEGGGNWLEVNGKDGRERVHHDTVKTIGVAVTGRATEQPSQTEQPRLRRFLGR